MILVLKDAIGTEVVTNVTSIQAVGKNHMEFCVNGKKEQQDLRKTLSVEILPEN